MEKLHWTKTLYLIIFGIIVFMMFMYTDKITDKYNKEYNFNSDFKITYSQEYELCTCELNNMNNIKRQDFYDFCPYVMKMLNCTE